METTRNSKPVKLAKRAMWFLIARTFAITTAHANTVEEPTVQEDKRYDRLERFFQSFSCPAPHYVSEYLGAADQYAIDYRLLPAISVLESTCGIHQIKNNRWGWDSARRGFSSFRSGLEYIARQLSEGRYYKNKSLQEKVHMYNPNPQYARKVEKLMRKIDGGTVEVAQARGGPRSPLPGPIEKGQSDKQNIVTTLPAR